MAVAFAVAPIQHRNERLIADGALVIVLFAPFVWWMAFRPLRRAADAALQESDQRYHSLFANMIEGYAYCRMLYREGRPQDFVYIDVNRAFGELTGLQNAVGRTGNDVVPGISASNPELLEVYGRVASSGTPETFETYVEPLGIWFRIYVYSPAREYFVAIFENVTMRKAAEAEQLHTQQQLRLQSGALNAAANAIIITNPAGAIEWINPAFTAMTGFTLDEVATRTPRLIKSDKTDPAIHRDLWATIRDGRVWHGELVNQRKDGTLYHQDLTITPVRDPSGTVTHFVGVSQDVTTRHKLEGQLRQAQKMEAIGQLTGGIAHDFNNILSVILANTDLIAATSAPGVQRDLDDIRVATMRGAAMIRQLMAFSRQADLHMVPVDLNDVIREVSGMLRRLLPETVRIEEHIDQPVGVVRADVGALEQVLFNLATNARDAMPGGGTIQIETISVVLGDEHRDAHPWVVPGEYTCLSFSDTGDGMDDETKRRMFEPFFTTKLVGKGTGLGMAMIYGLVKDHRGFVHVYSEKGMGTTIKVYLPVVHDEHAIHLRKRAPPAEIRGGSETILLAEDEEILRTSATRILEKLGYRVLAAADGVEALSVWRAQRGKIDLVISDMVMPQLGGRELYETLRLDYPAVRFVLISGYTRSELRVQDAPGLPLKHVAKPWTIAELAGAVREVLDQSPA